VQACGGTQAKAVASQAGRYNDGMLLEGIFPPLTTCFHGDGRPYWRKLEQNVEHYSRTPVSGLVLLGSTGEAVMLSDDESRDVLRIAREAAAPEKVLLAGVGRESVFETVRLAEYAAQIDYDAVLVRTPFYYRPQMGQREVVTYYQTIADRSPLPVVLYNIPAYTAYDLPVAAVAELAMHPNIIGMKDSSGSIERIRQIVESTRAAKKRLVTVTNIFTAVTARMLGASQRIAGRGPGDAASFVSTAALANLAQLDAGATVLAAAPPPALLKTRTREVGFQLLNGSAQILHASLTAGAAGGVLAVSTFAPQACHEIYTAWKEGDSALADEKQQRVIRAGKEICGQMGVPGVKHALDLNGYFGGIARMPLLPLTADAKRTAEEILEDLRN
jgi:4-hydroxy-2-oxoglutarate aldolase